MLTRLTCENIGSLDEGRAEGVVNAALGSIYRDIEDRGHDEKPRVLQITVTLAATKGLVVVDLQAQAKLPPYRTNLTSAKMLTASDTKQPVLCFQDESADNPDQESFEFESKKEKP